jgi:hypothetical protein
VEKAIFGVWPSLFTQDKVAEKLKRGAETPKQPWKSTCKLYKETIKARSINFQNRSIYMLIIQSNSAFQVVNNMYNLSPILNAIQLMTWKQRVHAYMKTLVKNAGAGQCSNDRAAQEKASSRDNKNLKLLLVK